MPRGDVPPVYNRAALDQTPCQQCRATRAPVLSFGGEVLALKCPCTTFARCVKCGGFTTDLKKHSKAEHEPRARARVVRAGVAE